MPKTVDRIVYTSVATVPFTDSDLAQLLVLSRANNEASGLTGLLLYTDGHFMQVLEGPKAKIRSVLVRIAADARHTGVFTVLEEQEVERRFGDWAMGFMAVSAERLADLPGYNPALLDPDQRDRPWLDTTQVERLIDSFLGR